MIYVESGEQRRLAGWLRRMRQEGALDLVILRRLSETEPLATVRAKGRDLSIASRLLADALDDSDATETARKYEAVAFRKGRKASVGRIVFAPRPKPAAVAAGDASTAATLQLEALARAQADVAREIARACEALAALRSSPKETQSPPPSAAEDPKVQEARDRAWEKLELLVPVLLNRLAGKKLLEEPDVPTTDLVKAFLKSLRAEQMAGLQRALGPDQLIVLLEIYEAYRRAEAAPSRNGDSSSKSPDATRAEDRSSPGRD